MIGERSLARGCSKYENSQNAIVELPLNSRDSARFLQQFSKTDVDEGMWKMNQKESIHLVKI
jgi:hypothetical protein